VNPAGSRALPPAGDFSRILQLGQYYPDPLSPHSGTCPLDIRQSELPCLLPNCSVDNLAFRPLRGTHLPDAVFELPVGGFKNIEKVIDIGPGIMIENYSNFIGALCAFA